jgi:hypothetical protein
MENRATPVVFKLVGMGLEIVNRSRYQAAISFFSLKRISFLNKVGLFF